MNRSKGFLETSCRGEKRSVCVVIAILGVTIGTILLAYKSFASPAHEKATLQQVIVIFRHGDRTPTESYPKDPYLNHPWPDGWGALTKKGMLELYNLGTWLRKEYNGFIDNPYRSAGMLIRSSYAERCIMSAQALLAGLYPPHAEDMFVPELKWRPVPVHTIPRDMDELITAAKDCPRMKAALTEAVSNESVKPDVQIYIKELPEFTGQNYSTITDVEFLYNTLEIEEKSGLVLPDWTKKYYNAKMKEIAARSLAAFTSNTLQRRLRAGPLLKEILKHMNEDEKTRRKAYFFSGHDTTLVNTLRTMGFKDELFKPDYGATLIFELHSINGGRGQEVKVSYINNTVTLVPHAIVIPGCTPPCFLQDLAEVWKDVIPEDRDKECAL